jgi:ABC-type transport system involved in cytochrome c biogenesis permease subunit
MIIVIYLFIEWKFKLRIIGAFAVPFAFLAMAYASISTGIGKGIEPLVPALQSNWLIAHVITCFIGYASFAVAAGLGIMYLMKDSSTNKRTSDDNPYRESASFATNRRHHP